MEHFGGERFQDNKDQRSLHEETDCRTSHSSRALPLLFAPEAGAANTIKIGIVDSYSGGAAAFGLDLLDGFKMAVAEINGQGGVLGKKIEFVTRDEKFQPAVALSMAKELVMKEHVDLLMGTISSASALAISQFAKTEKIPFSSALIRKATRS